MSQAKVYVIPLRNLADVLQGRARILNLPSDAQIVAAVASREGLGFRVHSHSFPCTEQGEQLPLVTAALERPGR